jgi:hypothetical protein
MTPDPFYLSSPSRAYYRSPADERASWENRARKDAVREDHGFVCANEGDERKEEVEAEDNRSETSRNPLAMRR